MRFFKGYRSPQLLRRLLEAAISALGISSGVAAASWTMFDAGAGTGQCGEHMRPLFKRIIVVSRSLSHSALIPNLNLTLNVKWRRKAAAC